MDAAPFPFPNIRSRSGVAAFESKIMFEQIKTFSAREDGAVTVDWVVLTAAIVGLAIASFAAIQQGSTSVGNNVGSYLTDTTVEDIIDLDG